MPTTVNGIGTHYYGRSNPSARLGNCHSCGAWVSMESYDTRLWFVVVFIPIIPLGRKRITDECPSCRRHYVADLHEWEMQRQLNTSATLDRYREQPTPESALEVHANMLGFRMFDDAKRFRDEILPLHADSATLHAGLATQLDAVGDFAGASELFASAYALRPDLPAARQGMAFRRMNEGNLDEARQLLDYMLQPGAGQLHDLNPLMVLAEQMQKAGRHQDTLDLCKHVLAEHPQMGDGRQFRAFVKTSEKALAAGDTLLQPRRFSLGKFFSSGNDAYPTWQRNTVLALVALALIGGALAIHNEYRRQHRTVHVLNDLGAPVQVSIGGADPVAVVGSATLTVPEGKQHVKIEGALQDEFDIELNASYFGRWFRSPLWIVNVGGGSALQFEEIHYSTVPRPPNFTVYVGENFHEFDDVDYPFTQPPQTIKIKKGHGDVRKTHVDRINLPAVGLFVYAFNRTPEKALRFAESRLLNPRTEEDFVETYALLAAQGGHQARVESYLKKGLSRRPVSIPWHRAYHHVARGPDVDAALRREYDDALKKEPESAALLYLRGRIAENSTEATSYFERASRADPGLAWPWYALAHRQAARADWKKAQSYLAKLPANTPKVGNWDMFLHVIRLGAGEAGGIVRELGPVVRAKQPVETRMEMLNLCDALAVMGNTAEGRRHLTEWTQKLPPTARDDPHSRGTRGACYYELGDYPAAAAEFERVPLNQRAFFPLYYFTETSKPREVANSIPAGQPIDGHGALALSLSFSLARDDAAAATWREKACAEFATQGTEERRVAAWLRGAAPPTPTEIEELNEFPSQKALVLAALAVKFPEKKAELSGYARRLNVSRQPPYRLVETICGSGRAPAGPRP